MVAQVYSAAFQGIDVLPISVQVQLSPGLPAFNIVGLADKAVAESRERVRASFQSLGLDLPPKRITINLAPADVQKEGSHYDLPIALGLMVALKILSAEDISSFLVMGELGLDGSISAVQGILPAAIEAQRRGWGIICPQSGGSEAAWAGKLEILAAPHLLALINHFKGTQLLSVPKAPVYVPPPTLPDMQEVKGQTLAKRALEIAAAGGHHVLMIGPPGSGKSMLASRLPSILPPLSAEEALEATMVHSLAGDIPESGIVQAPPFRSPHHSASQPALVGGGLRCRPGEISLAHRGVLFLDELPEFSRTALESLRQPLETGNVSIARANQRVCYPAQFQLIAAMNPCRCGYFGTPNRQCFKAPRCGYDYQEKISGPMMDRFDLVVEVPELSVQELLDAPHGEASATIQKRVVAARYYQRERYKTLPHVQKKGVAPRNAHIDSKTLEAITQLTPDVQEILRRAVEIFQLSGRGYHRILRVSRTIADLDESIHIQKKHISEAIAYRKIPVMLNKAA